MFTLRTEPPRRLSSLAFSPDGARLAACGEKGAVKVWDLATRAPLKCPLTGHKSNDRVFFADAGRELAVHRRDGQLLAVPVPGRKWRVVLSPEPGSRFYGEGVNCVAPLPGGGRVACHITDGVSARFGVFSLADAGPVWHRRIPHCPADLACSADGRRVVAVDVVSLTAYDAETGEPLASRERPGEASPTRLAVAPDGSAAAFCAASNLHFLRLPDGTHAHHRLGKTHFHGVAWHPSGGFFATVNGDGKVDFWDAGTAERRESFDWGTGKLTDIAFDAAGDRAAACSESGHIIIWDIDR